MSYASKTIATNLALSKLGQDRLQISDFDSDNTIAGVQARLHYDPALEELTRMHTWSCCKKRTQIGPYKVQIVNGLTFGSTTVILEATGTSASGRPIFDSVAPNTVIASDTDGYIKLEFDEDNGGRWKLTRRQSTTRTHFVTSTEYSPTLTFESGGDIGTVTIVKPEFEYDYQFRIPSDAQRSVYTTDQSSSYRYAKSNFAWKREGNAILTDFSPLYICYEAIPDTTDFDPLFGNAFTSYLAYKLAMPVTGDKELALLLQKEFQEIVLPEARRINGFERNESPNIDSEWLEATYTSASSSITSYPPFSLSSYGTFE
tara:strand:- start:5158 stop:6105 length:948 start_codon:yes stop_codon:yes gene_type:complete